MASERPSRVARIDRHELTGLPADWSDRERGLYLRLLLQGKGIDAARLFRVEYHPRRRCWLVTQLPGPARQPPPGAGPDDGSFYVQAMTLFRRAGLAAWSALAAASPYFARCGRPYEPGGAGPVLTPAGLVKLLGGPGGVSPVRFTGEGGWLAGSSGN
jgi:hypothetical protein